MLNMQNNGTPLNNNHKRNLSFTSSFKDSIQLLKDNLTPEIKRIKKWEFKSKYSLVLKKCEEKEKKEKNKILALSKKKESKRILEYDFMEEYNKDNYPVPNFNSKIYEKTTAEKEYTDKIVEEHRYFQNIKELSELKPTPGMNPKSLEIISNKEPNRIPVFLRTQHDIDKKKLLIETLKENLCVQENENSNSLKKRSKSFNKSMFNNWMDINQNWTQKKLSKIENLKKSQIQQKLDEEKENLVFSPKINPTSELIVNMKNGAETMRSQILTPIHEKLYKQHEEIRRKLEFKQNTSKPSFTPKINKYPSYMIQNKMNISSSKEFFYEAESAKLSRSNSINKNKLTPSNSKKYLVNLQTTPIQTPKKNQAYRSPINMQRSNSVNDFRFSSIQKNKEDNNLSISQIQNCSSYKLDNIDNLYNLNVRQNVSWKSPVTTVTLLSKSKTKTNLNTFKSKPVFK